MIKFIDEEIVVSAMLKKFRQEHGNLSIPVNFKTKDGYTFDAEGYNLFKKITDYQKDYDNKKISVEKRSELVKLGYNFKKTYKEIIWNQYYNLAKNYYEAHFNLNIPMDFITLDGVIESLDGFNLGNWLSEQIEAYYSDKLSGEEILELNDIGFFCIFGKEKIRGNWLRKLLFVRKYYKANGNFDIPVDFKTLDGVTFHSCGLNIGSWLNKQIVLYKEGKLNDTQLKLFKYINLNLDEYVFTTVNEKKWIKKYNLVKNYAEYYGDLNLMPCQFKTLDGINRNSKGINISAWLDYQRDLYHQGRLDPRKIKMLEDIGYDFNLTKDDIYWEENYLLAENFYNKQGHSSIPRDYITKNGISYDESGNYLGEWYYDQLIKFREGTLLPDRYVKLSKLNPVWWIKTEETRIDAICDFYEINTELNFDILNRINYYELNSKINFLLNNDLPLTVNGKLHEIFKMCSANMEQKYNITLEDIIKNYYNKELMLERINN